MLSGYRIPPVVFTVVYGYLFGNQGKKKFSARVYNKWQQVDGLWVPEKMVSYPWENDQLGEKRGETEIRNIAFSQDPPDEGLFAAPEGAYTE